nr:tetratricopeptide repeat-containing sensor histidine kinase [Mucilaginibacter sp. L294]
MPYPPPIKWFMKRCCWLLLLFSMPCYAQIAKVNELQGQLKKTIPDTTRLRLLGKLTEAYKTVDPEKKFYYSVIYKKLAEKLHDDKALADAYLSMGVSYGIRSRLDSAIYYYTLAYDTAVKTNYLIVMGKSLSNTGLSYTRLDDDKEAINYYLRALTILKKADFTKGVNQCYINIGSIYEDRREYQLANTYYTQALKSYTILKDTAGIGYALFCVGDTYAQVGQIEKGMDCLNRSLAIRIKLDDQNGIALVKKAIGRAYRKNKQYGLAVSNLNEALKIVQGLDEQYEQLAILLDLTDVYLNVPDYDKVKEYALQGIKIGKAIDSKSGVADCYLRLVTVYKKKHDIPKAFAAQSEMLAIQDSLQGEKSLKDVTLIEINRMRSENAVLAKDNHIITTKNTSILTKLNQYSNTIVFTSLVLVLAIFLLIVLYRRNAEKQASNKQLVVQQQEIANINKELAVLNEELNTQMELVNAQNTELERLNDIKTKFFSIISHDLRGPLATLQTLLAVYHDGIIGKKEFNSLLMKLEDTIISTGTFLDNLLEWSKSQLEGIVVKPANFNISECILENMRLYETKIGLKSLKVINQATEPIHVYADRNMINLVIRNLLSNSIKFCNPGDEIKLNAEINGDNVIVSIADTGPGISAANADKLFNLEHTLSMGTHGEKGNNLGLILCRDMVTQNNGKIWFDTKQDEGTVFWVELPGGAK